MASAPVTETVVADAAPTLHLQSSPPPYRAPSVGGGVQITNAWPGSKGPLFGEPLNVIISGLSSPVVLTPKGFLQYSHALGFSFECMGLHGGTPQQADLGDGKGWHDQVVEYREDYGCALLGTCIETFEGGNHFRAWQQDGPDSNTGALFLAVSKEEDLEKHHMIVPNGYNVGRDELVSFATAAPRKFSNVTYTTTAAQIIGLLPRGTQHINHGDTISQDGVVVLLTVTASAGTHK